jgi:hypothetical protein
MVLILDLAKHFLHDQILVTFQQNDVNSDLGHKKLT